MPFYCLFGDSLFYLSICSFQVLFVQGLWGLRCHVIVCLVILLIHVQEWNPMAYVSTSSYRQLLKLITWSAVAGW